MPMYVTRIFSLGPGLGRRRRTAQPCGVESVGDQLKLAVRLLRISGANLAARGLGNCDNGGGVCHGAGFGVAGDLRAPLAAKRKLTRSNVVVSHSSRKSTTTAR